MFDQTMLAPGPAGTSMLGERSIDSAADRGRERLAHEHEGMSFENGSKGIGEPATGPEREWGKFEEMSESQTKTAFQNESQFQNESAKSDYSDGPVHSRPDGKKGKKGGILGRIFRLKGPGSSSA